MGCCCSKSSRDGDSSNQRDLKRPLLPDGEVPPDGDRFNTFNENEEIMQRLRQNPHDTRPTLMPESANLAFGVCRIVVNGTLKGMGTHFHDGWVVTSQAVLPNMEAVGAAEFKFDAELRGAHFRSMVDRRAIGWTISVREYTTVASVVFVKMGYQRPNNIDVVPRFSEQEVLEQQLVKFLRCYDSPAAALPSRAQHGLEDDHKTPSLGSSRKKVRSRSNTARSADLEGDYGDSDGSFDSKDGLDTMIPYALPEEDDPSGVFSNGAGSNIFFQLPDFGSTLRVLAAEDLPLTPDSKLKTNGVLFLDGVASRSFLGAPLFTPTGGIAGVFLDIIPNVVSIVVTIGEICEIISKTVFQFHDVVSKMERLGLLQDELKASRADLIDAVLRRVHDFCFYSPLFLLVAPSNAALMDLECNLLAVTSPNFAPAALSRQARVAASSRRGLLSSLRDVEEDAQSQHPADRGRRFLQGTETGSVTSSMSILESPVNTFPFPANPFCALAVNEAPSGETLSVLAKKGAVIVHIVVPFFLHAPPSERTFALDAGSHMSFSPYRTSLGAAAEASGGDEESGPSGKQASDFLFFDCTVTLPLVFNPAVDRIDKSMLHTLVAASGRFHALSRCTYDTHAWELDWNTMLNYAADRSANGKHYRVLLQNFTPIKLKKRSVAVFPLGLAADTVDEHIDRVLARLNSPAVRHAVLLCSKWQLFQNMLKEQAGAPLSVPAAGAAEAGPADVAGPRASPFYMPGVALGAGATAAGVDVAGAWATATRTLNETFRDGDKGNRLAMMAAERNRSRVYTAKRRSDAIVNARQH